MTVAVDIAIRHALWRSAVPGLARTVRGAARAAAQAARPALPSCEISVVLADDAFVAGLNADWRGKAGPTNVLSFPALDLGPDDPVPAAPDAAPVALGDVVVAFETTRDEAAAARLAVADHLSHLVVHGVLHLLGHDHEATAAAERMEALEIRVLAGLGVADPYAGGQLVTARS